MGRWLTALAASVALHVALAVALAAWIGGARKVELPALDLSAVELSFSERESESAPSSPMPAVPPSAEAPRPESITPAEPPPDPLPPRPPEPSEPSFLEPVPEKTPVFEEILGTVPQESLGTVPQESMGTVPSDAAPRQAKIDAPAKPKKSIKPDYPKGARQRGEQGDVVLEMSVSALGVVEAAKVALSSGYAELDAAAEKAVRRALFVPASSQGGPVPSTVRLTIRFKLK